jgi:predicted ArsR family transcriptional regulator
MAHYVDAFETYKRIKRLLDYLVVPRSYAQMAEELDISLRQIYTYITALDKRGMVKIHHYEDVGRGRNVRFYILIKDTNTQDESN